MGRVFRLGQEHKVTVVILTVQGTYYKYAEYQICRRYARQLLAGNVIDRRLDLDVREVAAFELIRYFLGQRYSRYGWDKLLRNGGFDRPSEESTDMEGRF